MTLEILQNEHAQEVAAILRHTVYNPSAKNLNIDYIAWQQINSIFYGKPVGLASSQVSQFAACFASLLATISENHNLAPTEDGLNWLFTVIDERDNVSLSLLFAMATMEPQGDIISTQKAAEILGHADNTVIRKWCAAGRFLSAKKVDGRTWVLSQSELEVRTDV